MTDLLYAQTGRAITEAIAAGEYSIKFVDLNDYWPELLLTLPKSKSWNSVRVTATLRWDHLRLNWFYGWNEGNPIFSTVDVKFGLFSSYELERELLFDVVQLTMIERALYDALARKNSELEAAHKVRDLSIARRLQKSFGIS